MKEEVVHALAGVLTDQKSFLEVLQAMSDQMVIDRFADMINYVFSQRKHTQMPFGVKIIAERGKQVMNANEMLVFLQEVRNPDHDVQIAQFMLDQYIDMIPSLKPLLFGRLLAKMKDNFDILEENQQGFMDSMEKTLKYLEKLEYDSQLKQFCLLFLFDLLGDLRSNQLFTGMIMNTIKKVHRNQIELIQVFLQKQKFNRFHKQKECQEEIEREYTVKNDFNFAGFIQMVINIYENNSLFLPYSIIYKEKLLRECFIESVQQGNREESIILLDQIWLYNTSWNQYSSRELADFMFHATNFIGEQQNKPLRSQFMMQMKGIISVQKEITLCEAWKMIIYWTDNLKFLGYICYQMQSRVSPSCQILTSHEYQKWVMHNMMLKVKGQEQLSYFYGELINYIYFFYLRAAKNTDKNALLTNSQELAEIMQPVVKVIKQHACREEQVSEWNIIMYRIETIEEMSMQ